MEKTVANRDGGFSIKPFQCFLFHLLGCWRRQGVMDCGDGARESGIGAVGFRE